MTNDDKDDESKNWGPQGYAVVIGAIFLGFTQVLQLWLGYERENSKLMRDAEQQQVIAGVAVKQDEAHYDIQKALMTQTAIAEKVDEVHATTATLKDRMPTTSHIEAEIVLPRPQQTDQ